MDTSNREAIETQDKLEKKLPLNCAPLSHQVAGHFYNKEKLKLG